MIQGIKREISPSIIKIFVLVFVGMAFMNSIIFGITEYRDSKKLILREFKYISLSISRGLADSVWRNSRSEMVETVEELLYNYNISAIKIINYETNFIEEFRVKQGRKDSISYTSDLIFTYDQKKVKVGKLYIYTDKVAILHRAKKTLALIMLKTLIEIFIVIILLFWGFKKLFTDYLYNIKSTIQDRTYVPVNLNMKNSLPLLERAFRDVLNKFFKIYFKRNDKQDLIAVPKKELESSKVENKQIDNTKDSNYLLNFMNPNSEFFQKFFSSIFIYSKSYKKSSGDIYLFIEVEKNKEMILLMVDYGEEANINFTEIALILKDVEKDLMIKYSLNNRLFALGKIIDFMENKIRGKLSENGVKGFDEVVLKTLAMHYDKVNHKIEYSTKGILLVKETDNKLITYNDTGVYKDIIMQHKQQAGEEKREYSIDIETGSNIYIVTDGILKQVKKDKAKEVVGHRGFIEILSKIVKEPFNSQETHLKDELEKIKGDKPQSDNITVIGFNF